MLSFVIQIKYLMTFRGNFLLPWIRMEADADSVSAGSVLQHMQIHIT